MDATLARERLGTEPVKKLMIRMAAPSIVAMLMQSLYNTVDSIFVARISISSLSAITLAYPVQMFCGAISTGIGVGINSCISRSLGEGDPDKPSRAAANGLLLGLVSVLVMVVFGMTCTNWFLRLFTNDENVIHDGIIYIRTYCLLSFGAIYTQLTFSILQGSGNMVIPLVCQIVGAASVFALDPLFILAFNMGIFGAAMASGSAQIIAMTVGFYGVFVRNRKNLPVRLKGFKPDGKIIKDILVVGIPSALTQATTSVVSGIVNRIVSGYGVNAISVYGAYNRISSLGILPVFGVTRGMNPILGYSYGAKNRARFIQTRRFGLIAALVISSAVGLMFLLIPGTLLNMVKATPEMRETGMTAFRILALSMFISGVAIVLAQVFPPARRSYFTMIYTILRQVGLLVPLCLLFSKLWGITGVWTGYVVTDYSAFFIVLGLNIWFNRKVLDKWETTKEEAAI